MSKPASPTLIGAFVIGAIAIFVGALLILGGSRIFRPTVPVVMFFEGSVGGLNVGAPVTFRGVRVGQVTDVFLSYDTTDGDFTIPVFADLFPRNIVVMGGTSTDHSVGTGKTLLQAVEEQGLRAQLTTQSLVTGQLSINLDFFPRSTNAYQFHRTFPDRIEIPTVQSPLQAVQATLETVYSKIQQLPLEDMIQNFINLTKGADRLINDPKIAQIVSNTDATIADLRRVTSSVEQAIAPALDDLRATARTTSRTADTLRDRAEQSRGTIEQTDRTLAKVNATLDQMQTLLKNANSLIAPGSPLQFEAVNALREVGSAAQSVRSLANTLERTPNAVVFGRPQQGSGERP
jgi:paraquat-inducible protein B